MRWAHLRIQGSGYRGWLYALTEGGKGNEVARAAGTTANAVTRDSQWLGLSTLVVLCLLAPVAALAQSLDTVTRVIDGDTVVLSSLGTVRLIGVDTPETVDPRKPVQFFGKEASAFARTLTLGKQVRVEYDQQRTDRYHRTLAYLYLLDGTFVNMELVRQGYGHAYLAFPFRFMASFRDAEREAREGRRGLWADPQTQAAPTQSTPAASLRVWVNTASGVYHCLGTRYYGNTKSGGYLTQGEAKQKGYRAAYGRECR